MKIKVTWIVLVCSFLSLFYVMYSINTFNLSKPFTLIEIGNGNISAIKVGILAIGRKNIHANRNVSQQELPYSPKIDERRESLQSKMNDISSENETVIVKNTSDKIRIGILIPSSTRKLKSPALENLTLINTCLPSIYKTLEDKYEYQIYIGIDKGDYLETVKERLEKFQKVKAIVSTGRTFTKSVNSVARKAYRDGMDYFVRINDDSSFETGNWTSKGIKVLTKYSPFNIGVVGPTCHQGNTAILTHDMVHRKHLEIFDFYYPPYFDNWWADDWITKVYLPNRSTKMSTWVVKHHIESHGTRYNVDYKKEIRLVKMLAFDKERLDEYISNLK